MLRSTNDAPKHPTTITEPSVVDRLDEPDYVQRMLNTYLPGRDHEAPVQRRVLAMMSELSGTKIDTMKGLLVAIRQSEPQERELVAQPQVTAKPAPAA